jgi:hypothetical protein
VQHATTSSSEYIGEAKGGANMKRIPAKKKVTPGNTYYWRVDARFGKDRIVKGDVWNFTAI